MPIPATDRDWRDALGAALREQRIAAGLTQDEVATATKRAWIKQVHLNTIGNLERGKTNFTIELLVRVINEIDGDLATIFTRADELLAEAATGAIHKPPPKNRGPLYLKDAR